MPPRISRETAQEMVDTINSCLQEGFSLAGPPWAKAEAGKRLNMSQDHVTKRLTAAKLYYSLEPGPAPPAPDLELPKFPDEDISVEQIIDHQTQRFEKRRASFDAHTWFPIKVKDNKPIGIMWYGDPHIDDNGCNWPVLRRHIAICKETEGLYGANVGDSTNNWGGRLVQLYAEQDTSVATARRLVEWFMIHSGVRWLIWLLGNHDTWGDGSAILAQMAKKFGTQKMVCHDWEARFTLRFPNGWEPRIYTAHNFKGTSIWNPMHGPMREGQMGEDADLYVCGDRHVSGEFMWENPSKGKMQSFVRVRGFKFMDDFARRRSFKEQTEGCSAITVFDPISQSISVHMNVEDGAGFLTWKRARK